MNKSIDSQNMAHKSQEVAQGNFQPQQVGTFLGVDFGKSKIGLAIADEETRMAFAFDTLKNDKEFFKNLKEIVSCEHVKAVVMGITGHEKDEESSREKMQFADLLEKELDIQVFLQEEMFTTKMAHGNIKMRGGKNIAATDDQEAARIILQEWLDAHKI